MAVGEWDQRQLCSDGACIGVIGADGTCKVCGRAAPNWGDERNRGLIDPQDEDDDLAADQDEDDDEEDDEEDDDEGGEEDDDEGGDDDDDDDDDDEDDDDEEAEASDPGIAAAPRGEWSVRRLCPDGACIGVIGPDDRCKVCGRRASDAPAAPPSEPAATPLAPAPPGEPAATPLAPAPAEPVAATATATEIAPPALAAGAATDREPCVSPGCGGHIGSDGRCAVCGKGAS
jgi:hypothetical protein